MTFSNFDTSKIAVGLLHLFFSFILTAREDVSVCLHIAHTSFKILTAFISYCNHFPFPVLIFLECVVYSLKKVRKQYGRLTWTVEQ